ncbi:MAG: hypothetical protein JSV56_10180 [Methanomassiliicoccales archaeon]|nr:MAG: hypothetical protein JSV56_10180 [Methanomassiliicoccales archaeon]
MKSLNEHYKVRDSDLMIYTSSSIDSEWKEKGSGSHFKRKSYLGRGHSSSVYKVQDTESGKFYAEKVRKSSRLAEIIYFISFQAPTPDRNEDAVRVAVLTRNLLKALTKKWHEEEERIPIIADAIGYRWDDEENTYSIMTEFIQGRGPKTKTNEIFELMEAMDLLQEHLFEAGLYGPAWQTDKSNMTSTSNFKFSNKDKKWYWIDAEPGMIALSIPREKRYLKAARQKHFSPLYADIDFQKLREYLIYEEITDLNDIVDSLEYHMRKWKEGEIAILRNKRSHRKEIKKSYIGNWQRKRFLSKKTEKMLYKSNIAFLLYLILGNLASFALNSRYRAKVVEDFFRKLEEDDIAPSGYRKHFILNYILKIVCPKFIHHYLASRQFRKYINKGFYNRNHRKIIAQDFIEDGIRQWEDQGRLTKSESQKIRKSNVNNMTMDVYITGFGAHLLIKGFTIFGDLLAIVNILGTSGLEFLKPLTLEFLLIDFLPWPLNAMAPLLLGPALRLTYVGYSKLRCSLEGRKVPHKVAALFSFGKFGIGNMAFPAQMVYSENKFSMEYLLSKMGKKFPIFGGTDSRIEHWFIRRVNMKDTLHPLKRRADIPKRIKKVPSTPMMKITAVFLYLSVLLYVLVFRVLFDIVGSNEPEYFPMEIITTACIICTIIFIYMIYYEEKLNIGRKNILYPLLIVTFCAYYLAENNWLLIRDYLLGTVIFGVVAGMVLLFALLRMFYIDQKVGFVFFLGLSFLMLGTFVDASVDGLIPINLGIAYTGIIEEVLELFASMLILHSFMLLYFGTKTDVPVMVKNRLDLVKIGSGSLLFGLGNSFLISDIGRIASIQRILFGLLIIAIGSVVLFSYLRSRRRTKTPLDKSVMAAGTYVKLMVMKILKT